MHGPLNWCLCRRRDWSACDICHRLPSYRDPCFEQFRLLYWTGDTYRLSGVTRRLFSPSSYGQPVFFPASDDQPTETVTFRPEDHAEVCVFHDDCWEILRRFFDDGPTPWARLFETLRFKVSLRPCLVRCRPSRPPRITKVDYIHPKRRQRFELTKYRAQREGTVVWAKSDVFNVFPLEICYEIVKDLSMPDFYNLRLVSRYMGGLFFSAEFWASQFDIQRSRGWLSCLKDRPLEKRPKGEDWHRRYWCSIRPLTSTRKEVWHCCLWIKQMVSVVFPPWSPKTLQLPPKEKDYMWKKLRTKPADMAGSLSQLRTFHIPCDLTTIVISMANVRTETFVTGLRFLSKEKVISVGDILPDSLIIPIQGVFDGFEVASCTGGIQALKVVVDKVASSWFGKVSGTTTLLTLPAQPDILRAGFSAQTDFFNRQRHPFVMNALWIGFETSQCEKVASQDYNTWVPQIPPCVKDLHFNLNAFYRLNPETTSNCPISWVLFGDHDGDQLWYLTQIAVWKYQERPSKICFAYRKRMKTESRTLELNWSEGPSQMCKSGEICQWVFDIDGPGGERISQVKAVNYINKAGASTMTPRYYEIQTNRGRSFDTSSAPRRNKGKKKVKYHLQRQDLNALGTTPVGFYGFKRGALGHVSLGVISAKIY